MTNLNNEVLKRKTRKCWPDIASDLDPKGDIVNRLFAEEIITTQQMTEINGFPDRGTRVEKLSPLLFQTSHPKAFVVFREALQNGDHNRLANLIDEGIIINRSKVIHENNNFIHISYFRHIHQVTATSFVEKY